MEEHNIRVGMRILKLIDDTRGLLDRVFKMKDDELLIRNDVCPSCVPIPREVRNEVYELIESAYIEKLKEYENQLKEL